METLKANQQAYMTQLMDQELLFKSNTFTSFLVTWLIRFNDPAQKHPSPTVELPLPKEVSLDFRVLPEYILDNVIEYYVFLTRYVLFKSRDVTFSFQFVGQTHEASTSQGKRSCSHS